jgi:imidazolonepropionase-like amidohydrolase
MPNTSKSSKKSAPANGGNVKPEFVDAFTPLYLNGVQNLAELQKQSLDLAAEQTAEFVGAWKKSLSFFPVTVPSFMFDLAGQAVQTLVNTQKDAIDLAVEQTHAVAKIQKERAEAYSKIMETVTATFKTSIERSVEAQKKALQFASAQSKAVFQAAKKQVGDGPATAVVESLENGANTLVEAQKSLLDAATKPFLAAVN